MGWRDGKENMTYENARAEEKYHLVDALCIRMCAWVKYFVKWHALETCYKADL